MTIDLNDMMIFARVVKDSGFTAAGRALGLPRSTVSRRVARLERALGVRLLERTTRRLGLTEAGALTYEHCRRIGEEVEDATRALQTLLELPRGLLRVTASVTTGRHLIVPQLTDFLARYPEVRVELELTNRRVELVEEAFDVALRVGALEPSSLIARVVGPLRTGLFASPAYLAAKGIPAEPSDLTGHRCLSMVGSPAHRHWRLQGPGRAEVELKIEPLLAINDLDSLREAVAGGAGIAALPPYLAPMETNRLVRVLPDWSFAPTDCHFVYPSRRGATPKLRAFVDFMVERIGRKLAEA